VNLAEAPARLIRRPALLPVAQPKLRQGQVVLCAGVGWIALDRILVRTQCLIHAAHFQQGVSAIGGRAPVAQCLCPLKSSDRLRKTAFRVQQNAVHIHCFCIVRIARQSPAQPLPGACQIPPPRAELAPGHQRLHLLGIQCEGLAEMCFRRSWPVAFPLQNREVDPASKQIGAQLDRPLQRRFGIDFVRRGRLAQQAAQVHPGGGKVRPQHQRPPITRFGLFHPSQSRQHKASGKLGLWKTRTHGYRLLITHQRLLVPPHQSQRIAQAEVGGHQRRLPRESQLKFPPSLCQAARGNLQLTQPHPR
jgi:hypothetical protein